MSRKTAGKISPSQPTPQFRKGQHIMDVLMKISKAVRRHIIAKKDIIGLLIINQYTKKWTMLFLPKVE
eukprot:12732245-Ditylum_brightwellii.AAC.1